MRFRRLVITLLKPYRRTIVVASFLSLIAAGLDMLAPLVLGRGFDLADKGYRFSYYGTAILAWYLMRTVAALMRNRIAYHGQIIGEVVAEKHIADLSDQMLRRPLSFHYGQKSEATKKSVGDLQYLLNNFITSTIFDLVPAALTIIAIFFAVAVLDVRVMAALAAGIAAMVVLAWRIAPRMEQKLKEKNELSADIRSYAWDALRNVLVVKSTTNEGNFRKQMAAHLRRFVEVSRGFASFDWNAVGTKNAITDFASFAAIIIAVQGFAAGRLTFGNLATITAYVFSMFGYVQFMEWQYRTWMRVTAAHRIVAEAMRAPAENFDDGREITLRGGVVFDHVRFRYREDKPTHEDVSFSVAAGERVAIVGESGEGKTTLVDLIGRYYEPQSGRILIDGIDVRGINLRSLREQMAYVPQDLTLFHESLGFNIRYGRPDASDEEMRRAAKLAHLEDFIEALPEKYETVVGERGLKLSGGERQRVALARAFLRHPKILILDEPTAHLDSKTEHFIQSSLVELMKGRTTFIIAHRLRTVAEADVILVLKDGRIVESGTHQELVARGGVYAALLKAQGGFISPTEEHLS